MMILIFLVGAAVALLGLYRGWNNPDDTKAPKYIAVIGLVMMAIPLADWLLSGDQDEGRSSRDAIECEANDETSIGGSCTPSYGSN